MIKRNAWGRLPPQFGLTAEDQAIMQRGSDIACCIRDQMCIDSVPDEKLFSYGVKILIDNPEISPIAWCAFHGIK